MQVTQQTAEYSTGLGPNSRVSLLCASSNIMVSRMNTPVVAASSYVFIQPFGNRGVSLPGWGN